MNNRQLLELFIKDLNGMLGDYNVFPEVAQKNYAFDLKINENVDTINNKSFLGLDLYFIDGDKKHTISHKTFTSNICDELDSRKEGFFRQNYLELLRFSLFAEDCINKLGDDQFGNPINVISLRTLFKSGLEILNKK